MTYALICLYPDWLYRLRVVAVSRHLVHEHESSLIFSKSNPITRPCPALLVSLFPRVSSTTVTGCPLWKEPSFSAHLVGNGINSPAAFFCAGRVSRSETTLFIHSVDRTRVACVAKNRTPRQGAIRHGSRDP